MVGISVVWLGQTRVFRTKGNVSSCLIGPSLGIGLPRTVDISGETDIIYGQSGSAGEQPDRTKGRVVFSIGDRGPFAFSIPFVLKTPPVWQCRFKPQYASAG